MLEALAWNRRAASDSDNLELIRRARSGDQPAFEQLIRKYERRVLRVAYQMVGNVDDAQDVAQDVFIRLWKYLGKIRDEAKFSTWLYRLVVNASYDLLNRRRHGQHDHFSLDDPDGPTADLADGSIPVDREVAAIDLKAKALLALDRLTPSERTVFVLRDLEGMEVVEIARIHQSSKVTIRRHLSNARHKMRSILSELYPGFSRKGGEEAP